MGPRAMRAALAATVPGQTPPATPDDGAPRRDLAGLPPLDLTLEVRQGIEKAADLPRRLDRAAMLPSDNITENLVFGARRHRTGGQ